MQSLHPHTVSRCGVARPQCITTGGRSNSTSLIVPKGRGSVAAYRQTDNRLCVGHGCFKAPVFRICECVIKQRCQNLGARGRDDDRIHEFHSRSPNTENKIPLSRKVHNSGKKIHLFLTQTQDNVQY